MQQLKNQRNMQKFSTEIKTQAKTKQNKRKLVG